MNPGFYDFILYQGATFEREVEVTLPSGSAFPLTGYTPRMQMRENYESETAFDFSCSVVNGKIKISMSAAAANSIPAGRYVYDLEIFNNTGLVHRVLNGIVTVSAQVTR